MPHSQINKMKEDMGTYDWSGFYQIESAHEKADMLQNIIYKKLDEYMPEKIVKFSSDDKEYFTPELKTLDRKRKHVYSWQGKSLNWRNLNKKFKRKLIKAKRNHYSRIISDIKISNPNQWYSKLKRMMSHNQQNSQIIVD